MYSYRYPICQFDFSRLRLILGIDGAAQDWNTSTNRSKNGGRKMEFHVMVGHLFRRTHQVASAVFFEEMGRQELDITPFQYAALSAIQLNPGVDQASVAAWTGCDRATVGGVVDRLVAKGYVSRAVSEKDRRARVLNLTDSGHDVLAQAHKATQRTQTRLTESLEDGETETLTRLLLKVLETDPR
ncbi:MarR family winged helix-turn-helix transcriptional regulator [Thalassovita mangrovi]|nr:MarR family winged helix-turn-helix transcriptional regulator [Thalassovita mangrovi]